MKIAQAIFIFEDKKFVPVMIGVIGVSHKSASVRVREKLAFDSNEAGFLASAILKNKYFREVVILSTCNRTEIYFVAEEICTNGAFKSIKSILTDTCNLEEDIQPYLFQYYHKETVRHLFKVVSGLDSMILGEYQIVSQVKAAYADAEENGRIGKIFHRFFNKALACSKHVRMSTPFNQGAFSVSYAAVEKCNEQFADLASRSILLIGAGDTGELVLKNLVRKGCHNIQITNRTKDKAEELASLYKGKVLPFENLMHGIHDAEIIISSITCKDPILEATQIKPWLNGHEKMVMIDLGVPRNIHPNVSEIPGMTLLNVDDLEEVIAMNAERKQEYVSLAEEIVETHVNEYTKWLNEQNLAPTIKNIEKAIVSLYQNELDAYKNSLSDAELEEIRKFNEYMSRKIKNKIVRQLKTVTDNGRITEFVGVINQLFEERQK